MVTVCGSCRSLSARTDRDPALIGKVADLVDTGSPLALGAEGKFAGRGFGIAGRVQMRHPLGGVWDEWYLAFEDGRWGWLAEAQGRFLLTFPEALRVAPPPFEALAAGGILNFGDQGQWTVAECSQGTFLTAQGELPWRPELGATYRFADLSGAHGAFATLDYGDDPPALFSGRETTLEELKIRVGTGMVAGGTRLKALSLNCPQCASPLALHAPDQTLRVTCPSCKSLLDASGGKLSFLKSLRQPDLQAWIPLGAEGVLRGVPYTCIGYMRRSCTVEDETYDWGEYLLLDKKHGFHWLTESDGHWSLVDPVAAGDVPPVDEGTRGITFNGHHYRRFQDVMAKVDGVYGEFYWKVDQGERARVTEFVHAPFSLAREHQQHPGGGEEINWSFASYLDGGDVWRGFRLSGAPPKPTGIYPNMPNPHRQRLSQMSTWLVVSLGLLLALVMYISITHRAVPIFTETYNLYERIPALQGLPAPTPGSPAWNTPRMPKMPTAASEGSAEPVFFSGPIEIKKAGHNLAIEMRSGVNNNWIAVEGALVSEQTGDLEQFEIVNSYYHGVDGGESWSEGTNREVVYLSGLEPGTYMLRVAPQWEDPRKPPPVPSFSLEIRSGVFRWTYVVLAFLAIIFWPLIQVMRVSAFEGRRWQESMYASTGGSSA